MITYAMAMFFYHCLNMKSNLPRCRSPDDPFSDEESSCEDVDDVIAELSGSFETVIVPQYTTSKNQKKKKPKKKRRVIPKLIQPRKRVKVRPKPKVPHLDKFIFSNQRPIPKQRRQV